MLTFSLVYVTIGLIMDAFNIMGFCISDAETGEESHIASFLMTVFAWPLAVIFWLALPDE
jgi:hypothetical protein